MDLTIIEGIQSVRTDFWDKIFGFITDFGALPGFILLFALLFWLYDKQYSINFAISYCSVAVINSVVFKNIFRRPRPLYQSEIFSPYTGYPTSYSFPSGHSASIGAMAGYNIYESRKNKKTFYIILPCAIIASLVIGFSRMYLGVHFLTDVIVGLAVGYGISYIFYRFLVIKSDKLFRWALLVVPVYIVALILTDSDTIITMGGTLVSIVVGINIESKWIKYDPKSYDTMWVKVLIGLPILIGYYAMVVFVKGSKYITALQYFGFGLVITCLVPFILSKLKVKQNDIKE